jgi:polar amino acid transport system substrate-binding protein
MTAVRTSVVILITLLIGSMCLAAPAGANVDQCAPPGIQSASALPTNLAKAATGPGADRYTTATVEPLTAVNANTLGLSVPGTLTVGTLSDAPPSICINSAGQFTGFDNELLRAIADKLGLKINFVGTEFSGLLAQVASRRFDVGSSSITTTDARRKTVGFTNGYDFGYFSLVVPSGSSITGFGKLAAGQRIGVVQGTVQEAYVIDTLHLQPVKFPDYNTVYASLKTLQIDAWVAPSQQAQGTVQPGDPAQIIENTFSLDNFVAWAVAKENHPLIDALNSGLDAIIADGTWARLYSDWVPRALPPGWKPGSKAAPAPQFISLLKASSLVYFLGLVANQRELFQVGRDLNAQTGNLSPLVAAGLFYLLLTVPLTHLVSFIDTRLRRGREPGREDLLDLSTTQEMI